MNLDLNILKGFLENPKFSVSIGLLFLGISDVILLSRNISEIAHFAIEIGCLILGAKLGKILDEKFKK
jgi:hypothetical protein